MTQVFFSLFNGDDDDGYDDDDGDDDDGVKTFPNRQKKSSLYFFFHFVQSSNVVVKKMFRLIFLQNIHTHSVYLVLLSLSLLLLLSKKKNGKFSDDNDNFLSLSLSGLDHLSKEEKKKFVPSLSLLIMLLSLKMMVDIFFVCLLRLILKTLFFHSLSFCVYVLSLLVMFFIHSFFAYILSHLLWAT